MSLSNIQVVAYLSQKNSYIYIYIYIYICQILIICPKYVFKDVKYSIQMSNRTASESFVLRRYIDAVRKKHQEDPDYVKWDLTVSSSFIMDSYIKPVNQILNVCLLYE
jgi:hypothetical protein